LEIAFFYDVDVEPIDRFHLLDLVAAHLRHVTFAVLHDHGIAGSRSAADRIVQVHHQEIRAPDDATGQVKLVRP